MRIYSHNHCQYDNIIRYEDEENEILGIFKTNAMIISRWRRKYLQFGSDKMSTPSSVSIKFLTPCWQKYYQIYSDTVFIHQLEVCSLPQNLPSEPLVCSQL